ncbi:MAG: hypothetical protein FVQ81_05595 [Candidatus Glassbacteria bacterium]|nr:hypothetical protein [Candidatus Glassbacteria bacterium]
MVTVTLTGVLAAGCGSDGGGGVVDPGSNIGQDHWWDNYLDANRQPITLSSGFKLVELSGDERTATRITSASMGLSLNFRIDADWRSTGGWLFRGANQGSSTLENLAGAVEVIKQSGRLRIGETFDWEGVREQPPGSFKFVRVNRFNQLAIRMPFSGFATDLMTTLLAEPYIGYPTDTTKSWQGPPINVSQGPGTEFQEILTYRIEYLGTRSLKESGTAIGSWDDVIKITGIANQGQGRIETYLAPNVGILYYYYITAFGQKAAGALAGFDLENRSTGGSAITDYFPTAGGNHWIYEFSPDDRVEQFRFSVE